MPSITPYPEIDPLVSELTSNLRPLLGENLAGLYLHGSLVLGDFDPQTSDIDLLVAVNADIDDRELEQLEQMHAAFARRHPAWDDRVEVCYISLDALRDIHTSRPLVNISPGEPIHRLENDRHWLIKWYQMRQHSLALLGPPVEEIIEPISREEFIEGVKDHVRHWDEWLQDMPANHYALSYVILTQCRALVAVRTGELVSKRQAAGWARQELPDWAGLIDRALQWKKAGRDTADDPAAFRETAGFVRFIQKRIVEG